MASTGIINGTLIKITVGGVSIDVQKSCELTVKHDVRTAINKDSAGWEETFAGKKSWEMTGEADFKADATTGFDALLTAMIAGTAVTLVFSTGVTGDKQYTGTAQVVDLSQSAGTEENGSISYSFKGNGAIVASTVA